jgi:hypothetical protein
LLLLARRSRPFKQAKNNSQDKIAVAAQGPGPLLSIGIFLRDARVFLASGFGRYVNPRWPSHYTLGEQNCIALPKVLNLPQPESLLPTDPDVA